MDIVIKSQETRTGVVFRILRNDKFMFAELPFQNYFYVEAKDYEANQEEFTKAFSFCVSKVKKIGHMMRIYLSNNFMRVKVREFWETRANTYEADIKANKRFLLDNEIPLNNEQIPYCFFDIETDDRLPLQKDDRGQVIQVGRILSFAAVDWRGNSFFLKLEEETDEAEKKFLKDIIHLFSSYGIISGWNSEGFDMPYIKQRCDLHNINYNILDYINHIDYLQLYKKYTRKSLPSYSLNNVSNTELDESKIEQAKGGGAIYRTWKDEPEKLEAYNVQDSKLVYRINQKVSFIEVSMKRADNAGCHVRSTMNNSDSGDFLLMREYKKAKVIMPSKPTRDEVEERKKRGKIGGGYTTCFKPGFHRNVHIWDFKCLDPETIITTEHGFKKLKDVHIGENVYNLKGIHKIINKSISTHTSYLKIKLDTGDELICSENHLIPTQSGLKFAKDLIIGHRLFTEENVLKYSDKVTDNYILDTMRICGLFLAEGSLLEVGKGNKKPYYSLRFSLHKKETYIKDFIIKYFEENYKYTPRVYFKKENGMRIVITSKEIFYHFNEIMKELPKLLMSENCAKEYIRWFMEGDGSYNISRKTIQVTQSEKNYGKIKLIYDLLKNLGIPCNLHKTYAICNDKKLNIWRIEIRHINYYEKQIGFAFKECDFLEKEQGHKERGFIKSIEKINESKELIDITVDKEQFFIANNILVHNSEYPSVIQTWNISPETFVEKISSYKEGEYNDYYVTPYDFENFPHPHRLYKKAEGVIPRAIKILITKRDAIKYKMKEFRDSNPEKYRQMYLEQYGYKTDANSIYGILSFPYSRYYNWDLGDTVTTCARATLKACNKALESWGCEVIGGDTDSSFVKIPEDLTPEEINQKLKDFLDEWTKQWNLDKHKLVFEHEEVRNPFFFVKKKHYAYKQDNGKIKIKGMEAIKADTNPLAAKLQKEFIHDIINENYDEKAWENKIDSLYNRVFNQELTTEELTLVKALKKMPADYEGDVIDKKTKKPKTKADGTIQRKSIPAHVQLGARLIGQGIDIYPGSKIRFIVVKDKPILALSPEEYESGSGIYQYKYKKKGWGDYEFSGGYDASYYWLRLIKPLIKVVYCYYGRLPEWSWQITESQLKKIMKDKDELED